MYSKHVLKFTALSILTLFSLGTAAFAADSASNRKNQTLWLGYQPIGIHVPTLIAPPVQVGMFLGGDAVVGLSSGSASSTQNDGSTTSTATFTNQGLWVRFFLGNSFNLLAAYDQRTWTADTSVSQQITSGFTTTTAKARATLEAKSSVVTLGIANHWTFDSGFTIGADWLLLSGAMSSSTSSTVTSNTGVSTAQLTKDLDSLASVLNQISALGGLTVLTLGWTF